jgi:putative transcriptional regulator
LAALCQVLDCQPGDLLRWEPDEDKAATSQDTLRDPALDGQHLGA